MLHPSRFGTSVTEQDFRHPDFYHAKPEDYEFRQDGRLVRKDRWEQAVRTIASVTGVGSRSFEIEDVLTAVEALARQEQEWVYLNDLTEEEYPSATEAIDLRLADGSVLVRGCLEGDRTKGYVWTWRGLNVSASVAAWREASPAEGEPNS